MRKIVCCLALLGILRAVQAAEEHVGTYAETDIERGAHVYYSGCVLCHGPNGDAVPRRGTITTQSLPAPAFYYAKDYHQQYLAKNPGEYCPDHSCRVTFISAELAVGEKA
jgi:cytochrome c553